MNKTADLILTGGRIYTADPGGRWVEAVAVRGGRILAIGTAAEMKGLQGTDTETVDLAGRMVMPAFNDVHNHILLAGQSALYELQFPSSASVDEICDHVRNHASRMKPGQWVVGNAWGADMITALNKETSLAKLDAASPDNPVMLRDESMHNRWVNTVAMRIVGISDNVSPPPQGGFGRDPETGRLTGILIEAASGAVEFAADQAFTDEMRKASVKRAVEIANGLGITGFQEAATALPILQALADLDRAGELSGWAVGSLPLVQPGFLFGTAGDALLDVRHQYRTTHVKPNFTKLFLDGVPGAQTAAFHEAYLPDGAHPHGHRGEMLVEMPELIRMIDKSEKLGMALKIHCTGDLSVSTMLDAVEAVRHFNGPTTLRHQIAHASYIRPEDIKRFAELGVVADLCPMMWFPTAFLEGHKEVMGVERATAFWPIADLKNAGALIAGGSDWPVVPLPNPWIGIEGMVTRQNPFGDFPGVSLWAEQAIDLESAIRAYTINPATAMGIDDLTGSLEPGKSADLIILDQNVFDVPASRIGKTKVLTTYFEGRVVHQA
ncbi:amidohydrolase [Rhizobium alvei]|uniref:Amidohydrolase n=1 Tax=Rhizobium alvei TaxID=1132659 RepID=A0ABT8YRY9_9HYPH|nr:amidohydrolase [Rhizobium alvei]MDO6965935.1 amidohydrolase [Rhizobium alvei]